MCVFRKRARDTKVCVTCNLPRVASTHDGRIALEKKSSLARLLAVNNPVGLAASQTRSRGRRKKKRLANTAPRAPATHVKLTPTGPSTHSHRPRPLARSPQSGPTLIKQSFFLFSKRKTARERKREGEIETIEADWFPSWSGACDRSRPTSRPLPCSAESVGRRGRSSTDPGMWLWRLPPIS